MIQLDLPLTQTLFHQWPDPPEDVLGDPHIYPNPDTGLYEVTRARTPLTTKILEAMEKRAPSPKARRPAKSPKRYRCTLCGKPDCPAALTHFPYRRYPREQTA